MKEVVSYSQENEDIILYHMLQNVEAVNWIDIGANDPIDLSVTKFFSARGGQGINIEPQRQYIRRLKKDRPKDINLAVGVSNQTGTMKMYGRGVGASLDHELETVREWGGYYEVPVITLKMICKEHVPENQDIHFLKIDVEGWEKECIEGADFSRWRPWILCIEAEEPGSNAPRWKEWEEILFQNKYVYAGTSLPNRYYVSMEHLDLAERFLTSEEIKERYKITRFEYDKAAKRKLQSRDNIEFFLRHPLVTIKILVSKLKK